MSGATQANRGVVSNALSDVYGPPTADRFATILQRAGALDEQTSAARAQEVLAGHMVMAQAESVVRHILDRTTVLQGHF